MIISDDPSLTKQWSLIIDNGEEKKRERKKMKVGKKEERRMKTMLKRSDGK